MPRDWWEHDETHDLWYLTPDGRRHLRRRLTEERVWVVKQWFLVLVPVVALLIGLHRHDHRPAGDLAGAVETGLRG